MSQRWADVSHAFEPDGALLELHVFDTDLGAWRRVFDAIAGLPVCYTGDGVEVAPPRSVDEAFELRCTQNLLQQIYLGRLKVHCHFFDESEIEFDLDPAEYRGQAELDALVAFMRRVADASGRQCVLTFEGGDPYRIFSVRPGG